MAEYRIYEHPREGVTAVKQGWSWPAFLFGFVWAIFKNLYAVGFGVFFTFLALTQIGRALGGGAESAMDHATTVAGAILAVMFGLYGNGMVEKHLRDRGYTARATLSASGSRAARKQFLERRMSD